MNTEAIYDQYWKSGFHTTAEMEAKRFQKVFAPLIGLENVLDYGCGMGYAYQRQLVKSVKNYTGADVGTLALADAQKKGLKTLKINVENGTIDAPDNSFDGACCIEVFEHLFNPLQAARELRRVLKPGGMLVATVPNFGYHAWRLLALLRAQVPSEPEDAVGNRYGGVHIRFFSKLMLARMLRHASFENIRVGSFDDASVWDVFYAAGHFGRITKFAREKLPSPFHLSFLQDVWPNVFAIRLRVVAYKPK
jgi:SAM-dependent methyltransferase